MLVLELDINKIIFCICLLCLHLMSVRFIFVIADSGLFIPLDCCVFHSMYIPKFIHSTIDGYLGGFQVEALRRKRVTEHFST